MFEQFKEYFNTPHSQENYKIVSTMSPEEFKYLYDSLLPEEQLAFNYDLKLDEVGELSRLLVHIKLLHRFIDARKNNTWMDPDGVLHLTEESSILELPIDMNTYLACTEEACYTIGDVTNFTATTKNDQALYLVSLALQELASDSTIRVGGPAR